MEVHRNQRPLKTTEDANGCHIVVSHKPEENGYVKLSRFGKRFFAHRWVYIQEFGDIPEDLCVCHKCDVPACVNPKHLFLGTHTENMQDMHKKGRGLKGEDHGSSKLTSEEVQDIRTSKGFFAQRHLAKMYGVSQAQVSNIQAGKRWGHLELQEGQI